MSVDGRAISVRVDATKNGSHLIFRGALIRNVSVGGYVKIAKGFSEIVGRVEGESVGSARGTSDRYRSKRDLLDRELQLSIIGYFDRDGGFRRGVQELPLLDNECFVLTHEELARVHQFVGDDDRPIEIGTLPMEREQPISIGVNEVFASHVGIFGNTGSGKSYTLAKLYHELLREYASRETFNRKARFLLIDFNGEYVDLPAENGNEASTSVITAQKTVLSIDTENTSGDRIPFPSEAINDPDIWSVLLDATEKTQAPFLARALSSDYLDSRMGNNQALTSLIADRVWDAIKTSSQPEDKSRIDRFLNEMQLTLSPETASLLDDFNHHLRQNLNFHFNSKTFMYKDDDGDVHWANNDNDTPAFQKLRERIASLPLEFEVERDTRRIWLKILLQYYFEIFNGYANQEHLGPLLKRLESRVKSIDRAIRIDDTQTVLSSPLTVVSLRNADLETRKTIPLLLCKYLYSHHKSGENDYEHLNFIIDEAHTILSQVSSRESETWKDYRLETFEEIVKEGRKFGVFLTIASQRPHDIDPTIVSQLHNYFLHRLVNELDIRAINNSVAYLDKVAAEQIPILPIGTCVVSGISTSMPVVARIAKLPAAFEPNSKTPNLVESWAP